MIKQEIISQISRRFFFAIALLGIFSVISYAIFYSTVKMFESDSYVLNLSGQQRFLSQQIALLAYEMAAETGENRKDSLKNELDSAVHKMEERHNYLVHDNKIPGHFQSEAIKNIYFAPPVYLDNKVHNYIKAAKQLILSNGNSISEAELVASSSVLLLDLNRIVEQYQVENENDIRSFKLEKLTLLLVILCLLFLVWKLVFKKAIKELRYFINELVKKDSDLLYANIRLEKKVEARAQEIRAKENIYRTLVENMNGGLAHCTPDGIFTFVNDKYCRILGYEREELIHQPVFKIFHREDIEKIKQKISLREKGIREKYEMMLPRKNGGTIWLHINSTTIYENDKPTGVMMVITDLSEKKNTELLLADLNRFNEILLQTIPLGMQVVDMEGNVLYANHVMKDLAGFDPSGKKCWTVVHDDKMPCSKCLRSRGIEQVKLNVFELQQVFDGKTVQIYQAAINYHNTKAVLELYVDITLLKEAEKKLVDKNKELQTFITRASHDMRSPVANILGLTTILQKQFSPGEKQAIDYIGQSAKRMDKILIELINIGKVYNNSLSISPVNIEELLALINSDLLQRKDFLNIEFLPQVNSGNVFHTDKQFLYSILENLVDNSVKYRGKKASYVSVLVNDYKQGIQVQVSDNGQGMTPEVQERAFEMFYRGNLLSSGTGLGLYMVRTFVEKLRGEIKLQSEKNIGTTVTIFLPDLLKNSNEQPLHSIDNAHSVL